MSNIDEKTVDFLYAVGNLLPNEVRRMVERLTIQAVENGAEQVSLAKAEEAVQEILGMAYDQIDREAIKFARGR